MPNPSESNLSAKLARAEFVITTELTPPKGTDLTGLLDTAAALEGVVDAVNLTDSHSSRMSLSPVAVAHLLLEHPLTEEGFAEQGHSERGIEPIVQMTTRDRNRIALQSDMLGAAALGVTNLVCMGGDPPHLGDHPDAKPVFDLGTADLIAAAAALNRATDLAGNPLKGAPAFTIGAVVNPGADDLDLEITRFEEKVAAGATFFQTQAVYDVPRFCQFLDRTAHLQVAILAGILPIKSAKMARYMNANIPGIDIPEAQITAVTNAADPLDRSIAIAAETIAELRPRCAGVHLMTLGWERHIPAILARSGVRADSAWQSA